MAGLRRAIEWAIGEEDLAALRAIARSRTEPASRVERARMLLAYRKDPSFFAVGQALGVHHQTVQRCVERALAYGAMAALDDRPRPGKEPTITAEARTWLVSLACRKARDLGYPHELWTTRHGPERARDAVGAAKRLFGQPPSECAARTTAANPGDRRRHHSEDP
jgi:transposase